ncbi:hypothetical protein F443_16686 [Phytophthora nicotianae P1569]|uniref:Uncharacterized protein n=1 Tax=Phytophthora nicotianae P1569 TaxID=1317065 RepID=V9EDV0_PHYNI|nr:hypothetical protein F443_16686 [Phytophthora nicotianae P1569]
MHLEFPPIRHSRVRWHEPRRRFGQPLVPFHTPATIVHLDPRIRDVDDLRFVPPAVGVQCVHTLVQFKLRSPLFQFLRSPLFSRGRRRRRWSYSLGVWNVAMTCSALLQSRRIHVHAKSSTHGHHLATHGPVVAKLQGQRTPHRLADQSEVHIFH